MQYGNIVLGINENKYEMTKCITSNITVQLDMSNLDNMKMKF